MQTKGVIICSLSGTPLPHEIAQAGYIPYDGTFLIFGGAKLSSGSPERLDTIYKVHNLKISHLQCMATKTKFVYMMIHSSMRKTMALGLC